MLQRLRRDQQGATMVLAAASLTLLLLFAGLALDFGRAHLLRTHLQTAVDAAALAGALQVIPMVELEIPRWRRVPDTCFDPVTGAPYRCYYWEPAPPARVSGPRWDLINRGQWRQAVGSQCTSPYRCDSAYQIVREWLILPPNTIPVAENAFHANETWPGGSSGIRVTGLAVSTNPARVEVTATATMTVPTSFLKLIGIGELRLTRTGSAVPVPR